MEMTVNNKPYSVLRLLGKGQGGYSYLVPDGQKEDVLKQIHHEPCDYYQFGDKLQSELRDYDRLSAIGIPLIERTMVKELMKSGLESYEQLRDWVEKKYDLSDIKDLFVNTEIPIEDQKELKDYMYFIFYIFLLQ